MTQNENTTPRRPVALVTGGSSGLGLALVRALDVRGWTVLTDARGAERLTAALEGTGVRGVPGDVTDADHRTALVDLVAELGGLDLLVLGSSSLGPLPMRPLEEYRPEEIAAVFRETAGGPGAAAMVLRPPL